MIERILCGLEVKTGYQRSKSLVELNRAAPSDTYEQVRLCSARASARVDQSLLCSLG